MRKLILLLVMLVSAFNVYAVTVTMSAPASGSAQASPVEFKASATSTHTITGWAVYVDYNKVYGTPGPISSIDISVGLVGATHNVTVKAWDASGASGSVAFKVTVLPSPLAVLTNDAGKVPANLFVPLSGIGAMIAHDLPPVSSSNKQDVAVVSAVNVAFNDGLLPFPPGPYVLPDYQNFALAYTHANNTYADVSPKATLISYIQIFLRQDLNADGTVNWTGCTSTVKCVNQDITDLISVALDPTTGGWGVGGTVTQAQLTKFAIDLAHVIDTYNRS